MHFAREGFPYIFGLGGLSLALGLFGWGAVSAAVLVLALAVASFFRDPDRTPPPGDERLVSPADGRVVSIVDGVRPPGAAAGEFRRVAIFMSPANVHVNRIPLDGEIESVHHVPGKFFAAYSDAASLENERNEIFLRDAKGRRIAFVQIAGWMARRIVSHLEPGQRVSRGARFGLIMFGSRVDVYVPPTARVTVAEGDRVKAGETVLADMEGAG